MPIWISDYLQSRQPLDDGYVLFKDANGHDVYACAVTEGPIDDDGMIPVHFGPLIRYTGDGPLPPEHPDDIATDARILADMSPDERTLAGLDPQEESR